MASTSSPRSIYEQLRVHMDAADILNRLGIQPVRTSGSEAYCRPLCHESTSGESLQVNLHTGRWNCKACQLSGVHGDLIQLVEYVQTGGRAPSHGADQSHSPTHREAVKWLCGQYAIPYETTRALSNPALDVVHAFAMAAHRNLLGSPEVVEWVREKWGFDLGVIESYGIGYMPSPILPEIAAEAARPESRSAFASSGVGFYRKDEPFQTHFEGRVTFPYLEHGRAVYLIGRATPWTPVNPHSDRVAKYHKLTVHSPEKPYISTAITNDHLYNESILKGTEVVVIAEGVADAVALSSLGVPVVSPVTISFNATDLERFIKRAKEQKIQRVEILFDDELSGSGNIAARRVGRMLVERGLTVSLLTLPLGERQRAARAEVEKLLGVQLFEEFISADVNRRKAIVADVALDDARRTWLKEQVEASKIDAAEWCAMEGAGAAGKFNTVRKDGLDVVASEIASAARKVDQDADIYSRIGLFSESIKLAAHVDDRMIRDSYASLIAKAAGKGVTKATVVTRMQDARREHVDPKRAKAAEAEPSTAAPIELVLPPPIQPHTAPSAPPTPTADDGAPEAPPPPGAPTDGETEHSLFAKTREAVMRAVEEKFSEEEVGLHVSQSITMSMGFTAFRTPEDMYLVRGNERIPVGLSHHTPRFLNLIYLVSGLTPKKNSHRAYIAAAVYFLEHGSRWTRDVSWSYIGDGGAVFFPTGDLDGRIVRITAGKVELTRMADARVPAVAGEDFNAFSYRDRGDVDGVEAALDLFRWTSLLPSDRMVLVYWLVCLPLLRKIGTVPIVRIEGGSSSGKTRSVNLVSFLVNGGKVSSVPTAAALISRMSMSMLTIDDNRESGDVNAAFRGTLLQATSLGAREKRRVNSDTGTVTERVCGALLMNGIEPIHDGRSEIASRFLTLHCDRANRSDDSPSAEETLSFGALSIRDEFWSESVRRCAAALAYDEHFGERIGAQVEDAFGETRIGRLSAFIRVMYFAWVAGIEESKRAALLNNLSPVWSDALKLLGSKALYSLVGEELSVAAVRYAFAWGEQTATMVPGIAAKVAFDGKLAIDMTTGVSILGPMTAPQLARIVRSAGKELNAPRSITVELRAGPLEARLVDGRAFLEHAGFLTEIEVTRAGTRRFTFTRPAPDGYQPPPLAAEPELPPDPTS